DMMFCAQLVTAMKNCAVRSIRDQIEWQDQPFLVVGGERQRARMLRTTLAPGQRGQPSRCVDEQRAVPTACVVEREKSRRVRDRFLVCDIETKDRVGRRRPKFGLRASGLDHVERWRMAMDGEKSGALFVRRERQEMRQIETAVLDDVTPNGLL